MTAISSLEKIENIVFDLGGVLLDLSFERANQKFKDLFGQDFTRMAASPETKNAFLQFELGHYSEEAFLNALQRQVQPVPEGRRIMEAWNSLLGALPIHRLQMLEQLRHRRYQLYLLSNTNALHLSYLRRYLHKTYQLENFEEQYFDKTYYSHLLHLRKPDEEIFQLVLEDANIAATETLFIDDNANNILAAQKMGIQTIHHDSDTEILEVLQSFL